MAEVLRTYETIVITKLDLAEEKFQQLLDRTKNTITQMGKGAVIHSDDWGRAKIAYPIQKENRGRWTYVRYTSNSDGVKEISRTLQINESVLRHMTVKTSEDGSDYESLRQNIVADLETRGERRDWREERGSGPRRPWGNRRGNEGRGGDEGGEGGPGSDDFGSDNFDA